MQVYNYTFFLHIILCESIMSFAHSLLFYINMSEANNVGKAAKSFLFCCWSMGVGGGISDVNAERKRAEGVTFG